MSCSANSYAWNEACIPCSAPLSDWGVVCGSSVFDSGICGLDGGRSLPCKACLPGVDLIRSSAGISQWMSDRRGWTQESTVCKYQCPSGFSSNADSTAYPSQPCLNCMEEIRKVSCAGSDFFSYGFSDTNNVFLYGFSDTNNGVISRRPFLL